MRDREEENARLEDITLGLKRETHTSSRPLEYRLAVLSARV